MSEVTFPKPQSLTDRIETFTISRYTVGGTLNQVNEQPHARVLNFAFGALTVTQKNNFFSNVKANAGKEIILLDDLNRSWTGYIISNEITETLETEHHDNNNLEECPDNSTYGISFEFEGELSS